MDKNEKIRLILCIFYEIDSAYRLNHLDRIPNLSQKLIDLLEDIL